MAWGVMSIGPAWRNHNIGCRIFEIYYIFFLPSFKDLTIAAGDKEMNDLVDIKEKSIELNEFLPSFQKFCHHHSPWDDNM